MALRPPPLVHFEANYRWQNKHQNVSGSVARLYSAWNRTADGREPARQRFKAGLNVLRQIVLDAEAEGRRVRAYGGAWSLSDAAHTPDFLVNTKPLNYLSIGLKPSQVLPTEAARAKKLVFAQCGIHVMELNRALEAAGLALPTTGASNGQTFAGAVATGTHGAALHVGSMQDYVRGIHLVTENGAHVYLEPASAPLASEELVAALGAELRRDDALFHAALVSFGSFGLVHAFLFESVPLYELLKHRFVVDHEAALSFANLDFPRIAAQATLPPAAPYHFEMVFDPYDRERAYVTAMYQLAASRTARHRTSAGLEPGDDVLHLIGGLADLTAAPVPLLVSALAKAQLSPVSGERATPGQIFSGTSIRGTVLSAELGVSLSFARRAIEALVDEAREHDFPGLIAARFVKASAATLAFTRHAPTTCTIELPGVGGARATDFFARVWPRLDRENIPFTLHWGQCGDFSPARVKKMYGPAAVAWKNARHALLGPTGRRTFSNAFLERCGLAD